MVLFKQWVRMNFDGGFLNLCPAFSQNSYCDTNGQLGLKGNFGTFKSTKSQQVFLPSKIGQIKKKCALSR